MEAGSDGALSRLGETDQTRLDLVPRPARTVRGDDEVGVSIRSRTDGGQHGGSAMTGTAATDRLDSEPCGDIGHELTVPAAADKRQGDASAAIVFVKIGHERRAVMPEGDDDGGMLRLIDDAPAVLDGHAQG